MLPLNVHSLRGLVGVADYQGVSPGMYATRFFPSHTTFLSRSRHSHWLLLSFILASLFAAPCSKAGHLPTAVDLVKVKITLQRSACEGSCPEYKVTIHGDGRVVFTTETQPYRKLAAIVQGVVLPGTHEDQIAPETVAELFTQFRKAGFSISVLPGTEAIAR